MNTSLDRICESYSDGDLELLADFIRRTDAAGRDASLELSNA
jgi:hypothetical protein